MPIAIAAAALLLVLVVFALAPGEAEAAVAASSDAGQGGSGDGTGLELELAVVDMDHGAAQFPAGAGLFEQLDQVTSSAWRIPPAGAQYAELIRQAELASGLPENLLARTLYEESRFRPDIIDGRKKSSAGALGIAQFMPATARGAGIDPLDPQQAIPAAARELRAMFNRFGTWAKALAAYNWGQGNLGRKGIGAAPAETERYVAAITADVGLPGA